MILRGIQHLREWLKRKKGLKHIISERSDRRTILFDLFLLNHSFVQDDIALGARTC